MCGGSERNLQRFISFFIGRGSRWCATPRCARAGGRALSASARRPPSPTPPARRAAISCGGTTSSSSSSSSSLRASCCTPRRRLSLSVALGQAGTATGADWWYGCGGCCLSGRALAGMDAVGRDRRRGGRTGRRCRRRGRRGTTTAAGGRPRPRTRTG